jgi:DNA-binding transcriptional MerR regulator
MASIDQIIKDLEEIRDSGGVRSTGGGTAASRRQAALQAKEALANSKEFNKNSKKRLELEIKALRIAQNQYKLDEKEYKVIAEQIKTREKLIDQNEKMLAIGKKLGDSFVGLGKAAFEGSGSISAFTDNIKGLGTLGQRLDVNIETFRQLSQSGANFGQSIVQLRTAAAEAALPLDDFAQLIGQNSQSLSALFGSSTEGAKRIAELGRITREVGIDRLAPLGFTVDEINETLLLNLESQRRTGVLASLTDRQRTQSAIRFAEELDRLAKLTGQQRDELRAQIEQQQSNERFQAALQGATEETRTRLQGFAATVGNIAPGLNEGFQDLIANAGVPVTESALALVQNIPEAQSIIRSLINGTVTAEQALGQIRDAATGSVDRFRQATVTGQVEFLRLQGDVINLGRRIVDVDGAFADQNAQATSLVKNLTSFEQASKVLSSQFQSIETGLLSAFGPALGGLIGGIQNIMGGAGGIATALAKAPYLTASLFTAGLAGKFLFNKAMQIGIIAAGTRLGNSGVMQSIGGLKSGLKIGAKGLGRVGLGGVGAAGLAYSGGLAAGESTEEKILGVLGSAASGAMLGSVIPGVGTVIGGALGAAYGGYKALSGARAFGGPMDAGSTYLTGERGPELVTAGKSSTVTANNDLQKIFNTEALEAKMNTMVTALNTANQSLTNMVNGVNTLVAVEGRALKAVETTARKDRNQVGLV